MSHPTWICICRSVHRCWACQRSRALLLREAEAWNLVMKEEAESRALVCVCATPTIGYEHVDHARMSQAAALNGRSSIKWRARAHRRAGVRQRMHVCLVMFFKESLDSCSGTPPSLPPPPPLAAARLRLVTDPPNLVHVPNCSTNKCLRARPGLLRSLVPD